MKNLNKHIPLIMSIILLVFLLLPQLVFSQTKLDELIKSSDVIFYAKILSSEPHVMKSDGAIYTLTKFKVLQSIKGTLGADEYSFDQAGGRIGGSSTWVSHSIGIPSSGEVIMFLQKQIHMQGQPLWPIGVWPGSEGMISINEDQRVHSQYFIGVIERVLFDPTELTKFYEEQGKQQEVRYEAYQKGFKKLSVEQIREYDSGLANKIEMMKLEPWILPSGLPRPESYTPEFSSPIVTGSGYSQVSTMPEEAKKRTQRFIDSIKTIQEVKSEKQRMIDSINQYRSSHPAPRTESGAPLPFIEKGRVDSSGAIKKKD